MAHISEMIREKKLALQALSPHRPQYTSANKANPAVFYNEKRNETRDLVKALNIEQKNLYKALRDKSNNFYEKKNQEFGNLLYNPVKEYTANKATGFNN